MIDADEFGLLEVKARSSPTTPDDRLAAAFLEITNFVRVHDRLPTKDMSNIHESRLAMRLKAINESAEQREALRPFDELNLLSEPKAPESISEVVSNDPFGLLAEPVEQDLFRLQHVPKSRTTPDKIARRRPCADFENFEALFKSCHKDLRTGARKLLPFSKPSQIEAGKFFVMSGVLTYVAEMRDFTQDDNGDMNARTRCIFENGTESDLLLRSLSSNLYKNGRRVTQIDASVTERVHLTPDTVMGSVYVLRSLADDQQVAGVSDLHKIGATTRTAGERIVDAQKHATFLNAPVELVAEYRVPAVAALSVESILHRFFSAVRMDIWFERDGATVAEANEWFDVPLAVIDEAIGLIENESISSFTYVPDSKAIELQSAPTETGE